MKRRSFLTGTAAMMALGCAQNGYAADEQSLRQLAEAKGIYYGSAAKSVLLNIPTYSTLLAEQAGILVPEFELKRAALEYKPGGEFFGNADRIFDFADRNHQLMRGHTLVWHLVNPKWLEIELAQKPDEKKHLTDYIEAVVGHYKGRVHSWDVVNECINPQENGQDGLRVSSIWYKAFGERYIDAAFHAARAADPDALLFYNEYGIEMQDGWLQGKWYGDRRRAALSLLERLKSRNVPIDGFGLQSHLLAFDKKHLDQEVLNKFLRDVTGMGLKLMVTEMDVKNVPGPDDPTLRDATSASLVKAYLDVLLDYRETLAVLTWGLTSKYTWVDPSWKLKLAANFDMRNLPYDEHLQKTPMWDAIAQAIKHRSI